MGMLLPTGPLPKTYVFPSVSTTPLQTSPVGGGAPHTPFDTQVDAPVVPEFLKRFPKQLEGGIKKNQAMIRRSLATMQATTCSTETRQKLARNSPETRQKDLPGPGGLLSENHQKPLYFDGFLWKTSKNHCILIHFQQVHRR